MKTGKEELRKRNREGKRVEQNGRIKKERTNGKERVK